MSVSSSLLPSSESQLSTWANTLFRVGTLNKLMPDNEEALEKKKNSLGAIWNSARYLPRSSQVGDLATCLWKLDPKIFELYQNELGDEALTTQEKVTAKCEDFFLDLSACCGKPLVQSARGYDGPTCIVNYSRKISEKSRNWTQTAVFKWTNKEELLSSQIYKIFSECLSEKTRFYIPNSSFVNFEENNYIDEKGSFFCLKEKNCVQIRSNLIAATKIASSRTPENNAVLISEKIPGSILFDFAQGPYLFMNEHQKKHLFQSIGTLSLADIIFEQADRLIPFDSSFTKFDSTMTANLGNLMIVPPKNEEDGPKVYAIDNDVFSYEEKKIASHTFLAEFFGEEQFVEKLSHLVLQCIKNALEPSSFLFRKMDSPKKNQVSSSLQPFIKDLDTIACENIQQGILDAMHQLSSVNISANFQNISAHFIQKQLAIFQAQFGDTQQT